MTYYGDNAPKVTATVITLTVIAYIVLALRIYVRTTASAWGLDDWCMVIAIVPFTALTVACLGGSFRGVGVHEYRLDAQEKSVGLQYFFFFEVFYCAAIIPIKLSISFMLMRIAHGRKPYITSLYVISAMFTTMNIIALFYIIFQCRPVQFAWDTSIPGGHCNPAEILADVYYATTAVNIATDWFCAILPVPLLWNVKLNRNAKVSVGFILSLGALASLSACIRLVYTVNLTNATDYLHGVSDVLIWGYAENGVGMIVGCISTLRPLFKRVFNLGNTSRGGRTSPSFGHSNSRNLWASHPSKMGRDEEWLALHEGADGVGLGVTMGAKSDAMVVTGTKDSESEEYILGDGNRLGIGGNGGVGAGMAIGRERGMSASVSAGGPGGFSGIKVTKSVAQDVSYRAEEKKRGGL